MSTEKSFGEQLLEIINEQIADNDARKRELAEVKRLEGEAERAALRARHAAERADSSMTQIGIDIRRDLQIKRVNRLAERYLKSTQAVHDSHKNIVNLVSTGLGVPGGQDLGDLRDQPSGDRSGSVDVQDVSQRHNSSPSLVADSGAGDTASVGDGPLPGVEDDAPGSAWPWWPSWQITEADIHAVLAIEEFARSVWALISGHDASLVGYQHPERGRGARAR